MKKLIYLLPLALLSCGSGEDQQKQVCDCKAVYDKISNETEKLVEEGMGDMDARAKAEEDNKEAYEKCDKFHVEVGDEKFYEMGKNCK